MIYVFGKLVTQQEQAFLKTVLKETDRNLKIKHFKSIYYTARRNNTSLQNAYNIVENNKKYAEQMNQKLGLGNLYQTNVYGELVRHRRDLKGHEYVEKCSDEFIKNLTDKAAVNKEEPKKTLFQEVKSSVKSSIKRGWNMFKAAFSVC